MSLKTVPESQLAVLSVLSLCCSEVQSETREHNYNVNGALPPYVFFRGLLRERCLLLSICT